MKLLWQAFLAVEKNMWGRHRRTDAKIMMIALALILSTDLSVKFYSLGGVGLALRCPYSAGLFSYLPQFTSLTRNRVDLQISPTIW